VRALLPAALLLAACASAPEDPASAPPAPSRPATAGSEAPAAPAPPGAPAAAPAPPPPPAELPAPAALAEGDRWFVAVRAATGPAPIAERHRRTRAGDILREEVTWGRSFAEVAAAEHGVAQVFALLLDGRGLSVALLGPGDRPEGEPRVELPAPFRVGATWSAEALDGSIRALEEVDTPGGRVQALRSEIRSRRGRPLVMTLWYDAGLRPVRSEIRYGGTKELVEARAALASPSPTAEECRAAVEWARKHLAPGQGPD
jgi:hypothetical protein